jgi:hypothetical protein
MTWSFKLHFDYLFILYYIIYTYKLIYDNEIVDLITRLTISSLCYNN